MEDTQSDVQEDGSKDSEHAGQYGFEASGLSFGHVPACYQRMESGS